MSNNLMIVESPKKCKKLMSILKKISDKGDKWLVKASVGHIMDLNSGKDGKYGTLGIDKETLDMDYVASERGAKIIKDLKSLIKKNNYDRIVIATDPDREGEGIAEHLRVNLELGDDYERCTFNEITESAVKKAINNPRKVDRNMIMSQDARRILDRVVGWEASTAASKVVGKKTPMGRVQSKVVDFIVEREEERKRFKETKYFGITSKFENGWKASVDVKKSGLLNDDSPYWTNKEEADFYAAKIKKLVVTSVEKKVAEESAPMPFETSTMQQAAANKLGFNGSKCDAVAQQLYQLGHITYIRTDSTAISDEGFDTLKAYAESMGYPVLSKKRTGKAGAVAQEAHECIRPTDFSFDPSELKEDERKLYELIKIRCLASQLKPALYDQTVFELKVDTSDVNDVEQKDDSFDKLEDLLFKSSGRILTDQGWRVLLDGDDSEDEDDKESKDSDEDNDSIPDLSEGEVVTPSETKVDEKKTKMPPRYTQPSLIKKLKTHGIARPSTYSNIFKKIGQGDGQHGYVLEEGSKKTPRLTPSEHAVQMVQSTKNYLSIMDAEFTMNMENSLDEIAKGELERDGYIFNFFDLFDSELEKMIEEQGVKIRKVEYTNCLKCKEETLKRLPSKKKGSFWWKCENEECGATFSDKDGKPIDAISEFLDDEGKPKFPCPDCSKPIIRIKAKSGKTWWVCSAGKEKCGFIVPPIKGKDAPDIEGKIESRKRAEEWRKKIEESKNPDGTPINPCPECKNALVKVKVKDKDDVYYFRCASRKSECDYTCSCDDDGNPVHKD